MNLRGKRVRGTFIHAPERGTIDVLEGAVLTVDEAGTITQIGTGDADLALPAGTIVLPGFVDTHVHAPQYPQLGQALDVPLEVWLGKYTFPLEARYADLDFARPRYTALVEDLIAGGTTTALYFATVHLEATKLLADICAAKGAAGAGGQGRDGRSGRVPGGLSGCLGGGGAGRYAGLDRLCARHAERGHGCCRW